MDAPHPAPAPAPTPNWWRIGRVSLGFVLDIFDMSRGERDVLDALILSAVLDANVAPINQDPELQLRYAALDAPPPDALRRPVSISAVAASLNLPYESVRRRIVRLAKAGSCVVGPRGVMIPATAVDNAFYTTLATARYERLKRFYASLKALGALQPTPGAGGAPPPPAPPVRAVNRLISEYTLRVIETLMRRIGDPRSGLVLLEMARANSEHLDHEARALEGPVPDALRSPIRILPLARRLRMPAETVRRHVRGLAARGFCRRGPGGWLAALEKLGRADGGHGLIENLQNVQRLFAKLEALGVLALWDAEAGGAG